MKRWIAVVVLLFSSVCIGRAAEMPVFKRQVIPSPSEINLGWTLPYLWEDLDGDGLTDLLRVSPSAKAFIYRQSKSGFAAQPSQRIEFPKGTAWFTVADVSREPHKEILVSTADGLAYFHQNESGFETTARALVEAKQFFADSTVKFVRHVSRDNTYWKRQVQDGIPLVFSDHAVIYQADEKHRYTPRARIELEHRSSIWKDDRNPWSLGGRKSSELQIQTKAVDESATSEEKDVKYENEYIEKMAEKIAETGFQEHDIIEEDLDRDGNRDLTLVHLVQDIDVRTTLMIFFRRDDGKLPEKPDRILRCRGIPAAWDPSRYRYISPFADVNIDGFMDVVTLEAKKKAASVDAILETIISRGIDWSLTVRLYKEPKGYSSRADFKMDVTTVLPIFHQFADLITFNGDFNADGRPDVVIRRSQTQSDIYLSSARNGFFEREPKLQLEVPAEGWASIKDLNGDGISDIYLIDCEKGDITIFLSESSAKKGALQ